MGQRINAKGFRLAVTQRWGLKIPTTPKSTKKIIDLRFQLLKANQLLKKKNITLVDAFVLNYGSKLVFFFLVKKFLPNNVTKNVWKKYEKKVLKSNLITHKRGSSSFLQKDTLVSSNSKIKTFSENLGTKKSAVIVKYHKLYLNFLALRFFLERRLKKQITFFLYPLGTHSSMLNSSFLRKTFLSVQTRFKRYSRFVFFNKALKLIAISLLLVKPRILSEVIGVLLNLNKKHGFVLKFVENVVQFLLARWAGLLISGVRLQVAGKLNGRHRKKTKRIQLGLNPLQTLSVDVDYHLTTANTKFGSFGIGVWLFKSSNKNA